MSSEQHRDAAPAEKGERRTATTLNMVDIGDSLSIIDEEQVRGELETSVSSGLMSQDGMSEASDVVASEEGQVGGRKNSLELRKDIPGSLLLYNQNDIMDEMRDSLNPTQTLPKGRRKVFGKNGLLHHLFLNPSYSLRKQMLLTFGSVSSLTILIVMMVSIIASITTGNAIKDESKTSVEQWVNEFMSNTPQLVAEALSPMIMPNDLVDLMHEIVRDRFMGYPTTEDDTLTPFFDTKSQTNVYPLQNNRLPLDWDFRHTANEREGNVNTENYAEHVQDRWKWYSANPRLSTEVAMYTMQGACDPRATDPSALEYYPNCTNANNDISTGGVVAPSPTNEQVHRKSADLSPFLKALYEYHQDIKELGYYFGNSGAGSSIMLPHYEVDASSSYVSIGCEWMRKPNPINPELGPIATEEEIARCHPKDSVVPSREYNPLERGWCRDQALQPQRVHNIGPYIDAWNKEIWLMTAGRALYDPVTGAFVCCILIDFTTDGINEILEDVKVDDLGTLTLVRNDDTGTVVTSPNFDYDTANSTTTVDDPALETGVNLEMFNEIKDIFDFSQQWDSKDAYRAFETKLFNRGEYIISAHPIPSIPDEYDATYTPEFFAIFSLQKTKGIAPIVDNVSKEVDENVRDMIIFAVIIGLGGLAIVILLILVTSYLFAEPLKWMHKVGKQVVGKFGEDLDFGIDYERENSLLCSPKTELSSLAGEFSKMVTRFSGEGTAKRMKINDSEKMNVFDFSNDFAGLYRSREHISFAFSYPTTLNMPEEAKGHSVERCHFGPNIRSSPTSLSAARSSTTDVTNSGKTYKSPLFWWMVGLIVTPMLVTTIVISAVVLWQISNQLPSLIIPLKDEYLNMKNHYRFSATGMLAIRVRAVSEKAARDAHLLARFASWLYFGGITMSDSFTEVIEGAEECKTAVNETECEWIQYVPCDCAWNDFVVRGKENACTAYPSGSRSVQKVQFAAQSQDAEPDGSRYSTSHPDIATSPDTTAWWNNITVLPIAKEVSSRYGSSYDRVRIISALSIVFLPLYNYDTGNSKPSGSFIGFEADGMIAGFAGCDNWLATTSFWKSTKDNGAADLRPEICPLGKYGYDARCRGWYDDGKSKAEADNGTLHLTAPYLFASFALGGMVGQTITSPLIDPGTDNHIGQVLVDFFPDSVFRALKGNNTKLHKGGFPIMVTPESDVLGHDTVIGPGFSLKDGEGRSINDLFQTDDAFESILRRMKAGKQDSGIFLHTTAPSGEERMFINYAPVAVRNYYPLNSADITRGVRKDSTLVYSLALAETENGILEPFQSIDEIASKTSDICTVVLAVLIVISMILILSIADRVTTSMAEPILQLLGVLKDINCMRLGNEDVAKLSEYKGSCREVDSVYQTMEMLYKVVQFANIAFFAGDLEVAYEVLRDALHLFARLDNKKAIAVASNNLGNTMLTIYRTMKASGYEEMYGVSKREVVKKGIAYYAQSIKLGEASYDQFYKEEGWSEECLSFMQFLANRYFNHAIFFLTTSCDHEDQEEAESLGFRALQIAADMDVEIVDQCVDMGFNIDRVERYELMIGRVRGLMALAELGYSPDQLCIEGKITDVYQELRDAMKNPLHELFKEISAAGRMQKLDVELIKYLSHAKHDNVSAARVAIRMLVEDEFIFPDAGQVAIAMLLVYPKSTDDENFPDDEDGQIAKKLESIVESLERDHVRRSQNLLPLNNTTQLSRDGMKSMRSLMKNSASGNSQRNTSDRSAGRVTPDTSDIRSSAIKESCRFDVTMESF